MEAKILSIESIKLINLNSNTPFLVLLVEGQASTPGWSEFRLCPFVYLNPPANGIYEFNLIGKEPEYIGTQFSTAAAAVYVWKGFPENLKGIKVYGSANNRFRMLYGITEGEDNSALSGKHQLGQAI